MKINRVDHIDGQADLRWTSSPCQDFCNAGARSRADAEAAAEPMSAIDLGRHLLAGPLRRLVALENLLGRASWKDGDDPAAMAAAGHAAARAHSGYRRCEPPLPVALV